MKKKEPNIIGPLILITIGALFLLANFGYISSTFWLTLIQLWPLLLIFAGVEILLSRSGWGQLLTLLVGLLAMGGILWLALNPTTLNFGAGMQTVTVNKTRDGVTSGELVLNPAVGEVTVKSLDNASPNWVQGALAHPGSTEIQEQYNVSNGNAQLNLNSSGTAVFMGNATSQWNLLLAPHVPTRVNIDTGVGGSRLDLNALNVTTLQLHTGIGGADVVLPAHAGTVTAKLDSGIGTLNVLIPQGVPARIRSHTGIGGANINQTRFPRVGDDLYESPGYASATDKIDLDVNAGIGGITIP